MKRLLISMAVGAFSTAASAASLDAPLPHPPPTLRSEIKRGGDAAFDCSSLAQGVRGTCVLRAHAENEQQMRTGHDGFDTGLYFAAWSFEHATGDASERAMWQSYLEARRRAGVTDAQVVEAVGMTPTALASATDAAAQWGD